MVGRDVCHAVGCDRIMVVLSGVLDIGALKWSCRGFRTHDGRSSPAQRVCPFVREVYRGSQ